MHSLHKLDDRHYVKNKKTNFFVPTYANDVIRILLLLVLRPEALLLEVFTNNTSGGIFMDP